MKSGGCDNVEDAPVAFDVVIQRGGVGDDVGAAWWIGSLAENRSEKAVQARGLWTCPYRGQRFSPTRRRRRTVIVAGDDRRGDGCHG